MKKKVSISIEENLLKEVQSKLESNIFRNQSHFIEYATEKLLEELK